MVLYTWDYLVCMRAVGPKLFYVVLVYGNILDVIVCCDQSPAFGVKSKKNKKKHQTIEVKPLA